MKQRSFLLVHGWEGSGPEHWQTWLYNRLRSAGKTVHYPRLPDPDHPDRNRWLSTLSTEVMAMTGERIVICHSLGSVLWLHHADQESISVERLLLVAPPGPTAIAAVPEISGFLPVPLDSRKLWSSANEIRLVCTDQDEYCEERAAEYYGTKLDLPTDRLPPNAGHINTASGYGAWPAVEQWCFNREFRFG